MLKFLYTVAIGLLFAGFIGLGFATFYPAPKSPEYPESLQTFKTAEEMTTEERQSRDEADKKFRADQKSFEEQFKTYNRNLSIGLVIASLLIIAISMLGVGKLDVIGDGLTLGGVFTLFYGLIRTFMAGDEKIRFIAIAVGLVVIILLAYWKFVRPANHSTPGV